MWGFALWDSRKQELFLARDRFGVKPVYFTQNDSCFAYSSEIKPLTALLNSPAEINKAKIPFFVLYGNRLNTEDTYINGISSLKASHYLIYKNGNVNIHRYYDVKAKQHLESEDALKDKIVSLLSDSINLRFRSDVPVGTCLSGGFDSSSIVSLSGRLEKNKLQTF